MSAAPAGRMVVPMPTTTKEDIMSVDLIRILDTVYGEAINKGNVDALDGVFDPDYVEHGVLGDFTGVDAFKGLVAQWRQAFPDLHSTYTDVVQDQVAAIDAQGVDRLAGPAAEPGPAVVEARGPFGQAEPRQIEGDSAQSAVGEHR